MLFNTDFMGQMTHFLLLLVNISLTKRKGKLNWVICHKKPESS